jgi:hypothetical protein
MRIAMMTRALVDVVRMVDAMSNVIMMGIVTLANVLIVAKMGIVAGHLIVIIAETHGTMSANGAGGKPVAHANVTR